MYFLAQPPLGTDTEAITDDQHPNHQLWINRRSANVAIERGKVPTQVLEVQETIYAAQEVVRGNVFIEVEGVKQTTLIAAALTHHPRAPVTSSTNNTSDKR
jgi:hypothetical protein